VNLKAPFLCAQQAAPLMQTQGGGKIVNITSVHATDPKRTSPLQQFQSRPGDAFQVHGPGTGSVRHPGKPIIVGAIGTEMTPPDRQAIVIPAVPAGRIGAAEEIARLVASSVPIRATI